MLFRVILTYFHIECQREKEAKAKDLFNEAYNPDKTDVETKLPFMLKGTEMVELSLGTYKLSSPSPKSQSQDRRDLD